MMQPTYWHRFPDVGVAAACGAVVKVWDPSEPEKGIKLFEGTSVYSVSFSPNNKVLAVGGDKCQVSLYSSTPQPGGDRMIAQLPTVPDGSVDIATSIQFMPDTSLLCGCKNGSLLLFNFRTGGSTREFMGMNGSITSVVGSRSMEMLAAASSSGQVVVFDFQSGLRWKPLQRDGQQMPPVHHLALSRLDPQLLAGGNAAGQVLLWDLNHGHQTAQSSAVDVHKGAITGLACSDADPHLMITCGDDGRCKGWDRRTSKIAWSVANQQPLSCLAVRYDGQLVAVGTAAGAVLVQDVRCMDRPVSSQQFSDTSSPVTAVTWQHSLSSRVVSRAAAAAAAPVLQAGAASIMTRNAAASAVPAVGQQLARATAVPAAAAGSGDGGAAASSADPPCARGLIGRDGLSTALSSAAHSTSTTFSSVTTAAAVAAAAAVGVQPTPEPPGPALTPPTTQLGTGYDGGVQPFMITPGIELPAGLSTAMTPPLLAEVARGKEVTPGSSRLQTAPPAGRQPGAASCSSAAPGTEEVGAPLSRQQRPAGRTGVGSSNRGVGSGKAGRSEAGTAPTTAPGPAVTPGITAASLLAGTSSVSTAPAPSSSLKRPASRSSNNASPVRGAATRSNPGAGAAAAAGPTSAGVNSRGNSAPGSRGSTPRRGSLNEAPEFGGAGDASSRPGSAAGAVASADGALRAGAGSSRPQSATSEVAAPAVLGVGGLREDVFKAYLDQQMAELSQQMKSMHLDMLRQFHQAQMDLVSVVDGIVQRQDQLAEAVAELSAMVAQQGVGAKGHMQRQLQPGTIGLLPWI